MKEPWYARYHRFVRTRRGVLAALPGVIFPTIALVLLIAALLGWGTVRSFRKAIAGAVLALGAVAAFDAWAAEMTRGDARRAWLRALVIAALFTCFALLGSSC